MKPIKKILIVCTGNSCRSIMAEGYLVKRLAEEGMDGTIVISSGTGTIPGMKPTAETIRVMKEHGVDVSSYMSSSISKAHITNADAILIMEKKHRDVILEMIPGVEKKIYFLRGFSKNATRENDYIRDPIGRPLEFYREIFEIIKNSTEGFLKWLNE